MLPLVVIDHLDGIFARRYPFTVPRAVASTREIHPVHCDGILHELLIPLHVIDHAELIELLQVIVHADIPSQELIDGIIGPVLEAVELGIGIRGEPGDGLQCPVFPLLILPEQLGFVLQILFPTIRSLLVIEGGRIGDAV